MRKFILPLMVCLLAGCASNPQSSPPVPQRSKPAPSPVTSQPPSPASSAQNDWSDKIQTSLAYSAVVDGRRLAVHVGTVEFGRVMYNGMGIDSDEGPFYELRDADTGQVLRAMSWDEVHVVAGRGVYVLAAEQRFKRLKKSFSNSEEFLADVREGSTFLKRWDRFEKLDLASGRTSPTDVLVIDEQYADRRFISIGNRQWAIGNSFRFVQAPPNLQTFPADG